MRILCVHQGFELYGSDRVFLQSLRAIRAFHPDALIRVVLPREGPLAEQVRELTSDVQIRHRFLLRRSHFLRDRLDPRQWLILDAIRAWIEIRGFDLVYVSSIVVLDYLLAGILTNRRGLIHVHEIPGQFSALVFSLLLQLNRFHSIFVSEATARAYWRNDHRSRIVHNGTLDRALPVKADSDRIHFLVPGRMNSWKGQRLVLEAVAKLSEAQRERIRIRFVGDANEGQEKFRDELIQSVSDYGVEEMVQVTRFEPDMTPHYEWADVVVVPSLRPEPFGLVAIEAMSARRAVIAANHGGLREIVTSGKTGLLFQPGSSESLGNAFGTYLRDPSLIARHGDEGHADFSARFSEAAFQKRFSDVIRSLEDRP